MDRAQVAPVLVSQEAEEGAIVNHAQDIANVPCKPGARILIFTTGFPKNIASWENGYKYFFNQSKILCHSLSLNALEQIQNKKLFQSTLL